MSLCGQDLSLEKLAWDQNSAQGGQVLWLKSCINHHPSTAVLILNPALLLIFLCALLSFILW